MSSPTVEDRADPSAGDTHVPGPASAPPMPSAPSAPHAASQPASQPPAPDRGPGGLPEAAPCPEGFPIAEHEIGMDWGRTRAYIRADFERAVACLGGPESRIKLIYWWLLPQIQALIWYRVSRWLFLRGHRTAARTVHLIAIYLTGAELAPTASIGPGCVLGHAHGTRIGGRIGARLTVFADTGVGGGLGPEDIGGGPGLPWLGDDVSLAAKAMVLGPVRIGDGVRVGPGVILSQDVPAGALVFNPPPRVLRQAVGGASPGAEVRNEKQTGHGGKQHG